MRRKSTVTEKLRVSRMEPEYMVLYTEATGPVLGGYVVCQCSLESTARLIARLLNDAGWKPRDYP